LRINDWLNVQNKQIQVKGKEIMHIINTWFENNDWICDLWVLCKRLEKPTISKEVDEKTKYVDRIDWLQLCIE